MELEAQKSLAMAELNPILTTIASFEGTIESIDVSDEETQGQVGDVVKMMMSRRKKIDEKRDSLVRPLNGVVKDINGLFKPVLDRLDGIINTGKLKMNRFAQAQQLLADEQRRQERAAAEKERLEAEALAKALAAKVGDTAKETIEVVTQAAEKKVEKAAKPAKVAVSRGEQSSVSTKKTWKADVLSVRELCRAVADGELSEEVVEPAMRALLDYSRKVGVARTIYGVRFYQEVSTSVR